MALLREDTALTRRKAYTMTDRAFGWEAARERSAGGLVPLVREAAHYYLADREAGRPGWRYPRFRSGTGGSEWPVPDELPGIAGDDLCSAFAREADRQGVEQGQLLRHALLYYLADLDSGRVTARIADELD